MMNSPFIAVGNVLASRYFGTLVRICSGFEVVPLIDIRDEADLSSLS
jgi:hypothetical protein